MKKLLIIGTILFALSLNTFANNFEKEIIGAWTGEIKESLDDNESYIKMIMIANCDDKYFINKKASSFCKFKINIVNNQKQDESITLIEWLVASVCKWEIIDKTLLTEILKVKISEIPFEISNQEMLEKYSKIKGKKISSFKLNKKYKKLIDYFLIAIKTSMHVGAIESSKIESISKKEMILITDGMKEHYFRK